MRLFSEQDQSLPDERLEFRSGWINPAKFKRLMDSGPIPVGEDGEMAEAVFKKAKVFDGKGLIEEFPFHLDARDHGPKFDGRITILRTFELNRQFWWVKVPGSNGQPLYNTSLYLLSRKNLAPETWRVWIKWLHAQQRDKNTSTLTDFDF